MYILVYAAYHLSPLANEEHEILGEYFLPISGSDI
jgi:hypothetical protein